MKRFTLRQFFLAAAIAVAAAVAGAFWLFVRSSQADIARRAVFQQEEAATEVQTRVIAELDHAKHVLEAVDRGIRTGAIRVDDRRALEASLYLRVTDDERLVEIAFTRARLLGYKSNGDADIVPADTWELSVQRPSNEAVTTRLTRRDGDAFSAYAHTHGKDGTFALETFERVGTALDPAQAQTFAMLASEGLRGETRWSDLHHTGLDEKLPLALRRIVLTVQRPVADTDGRFVGVLRVGMLTSQLDRIVAQPPMEATRSDGRRIVLVAPGAPVGTELRLIARVRESDHLEEYAEEYRFVSDDPPPEVAALFANPIARGLDPDDPHAGDAELTVNGQQWLAALRPLDLGRTGGTRGWMVAVLVPKDRYAQELVAFERTFITLYGVTFGLVVTIGLAVLLSVQRVLARIVGQTTRMRSFDFAPTEGSSAFRELDEVIEGLERAKTVVRAMGKYIPLDLVRKLYASNREPELGGQLGEVTLMFTDIEGFTTLSERLSPDELARRLGDYLAAMTNAIEATGGTIDKYIGDAIMAMWNAPTSVPAHPREACRAALACMAAARDLYASPSWDGLPALVTRFGLHSTRVLVGHFGAPTRLSYTALGDGVNLAARLEPLCKQYGIVALASEVVVEQAREEFVFRRVDRVAVKGKSTGIDVYELLGAVGDEIPGLVLARAYERAFDAYLARDFGDAIQILEAECEADTVARVLLGRCRELASSPPPEGWDGVHVATSK